MNNKLRKCGQRCMSVGFAQKDTNLFGCVVAQTFVRRAKSAALHTLVTKAPDQSRTVW